MDTIKMTSTRCRHCGRVLEPSELPDYTWQCRDCDEDFYSFEAIQFTVQIEPVSSVTIKDFEEYNFNIDWSKRRKIIVTDGKHIGYVLETIDEIQKLGLEYIADHAMLRYDRILDDYAVTISRNDYYNDTERNPVKVIPVRFVEIESGTGREVYRGIESNRYYLREVASSEDFAKWYVCGTRRMPDDGDEPRPNLIFLNRNGQRERVTYDDWNGTAAYSETFNENFNAK